MFNRFYLFLSIMRQKVTERAEKGSSKMTDVKQTKHIYINRLLFTYLVFTNIYIYIYQGRTVIVKLGYRTYTSFLQQ